MGQRLRQHQALAVMVVTAQRPAHHLERHDPGLDAELALQALANRRRQVLRIGLQLGDNRLGQGLQLGEMVALRADQVADPISRRGLVRDRTRPVRPLEGAQVDQPAAIEIGPIEPGHGLGQARRQLGDLGGLVARHAQVGEHLVGQHLLQPRAATRIVGRQAAQVQIVSVRQPQQDLGRHRSLVALQQVQIAGRHAQFLGHPRLSHAQVASQPLQPAAEKELLVACFGVGCRHLVKLSQLYRNYKVDL